MRDNATFVKKKRAGLRFKYMRRSLRGLTKRPVKVSDLHELQQIDEYYREFIELPRP